MRCMATLLIALIPLPSYSILFIINDAFSLVTSFWRCRIGVDVKAGIVVLSWYWAWKPWFNVDVGCVTTYLPSIGFRFSPKVFATFTHRLYWSVIFSTVKRKLECVTGCVGTGNDFLSGSELSSDSPWFCASFTDSLVQFGATLPLTSFSCLVVCSQIWSSCWTWRSDNSSDTESFWLWLSIRLSISCINRLNNDCAIRGNRSSLHFLKPMPLSSTDLKCLSNLMSHLAPCIWVVHFETTTGLINSNAAGVACAYLVLECLKKNTLETKWNAKLRHWCMCSDWGMSRLIWVFAGRICYFVGFVMRRLICDCSQCIFRMQLNFRVQTDRA